jgi:acetyl-CoA synthetase
MAAQPSRQIDTVMHETRVFPPTAAFAAQARIKSLDEYQKLWDYAAADLQRFWGELATTELHWFTPFTKTLEWKEPFAKWFVGGKTNVAYNCLDRNLAAGLGSRTAILWEGEPGDSRTLTYAELHRDVCKFANALKNLGIKAGDRVSIYMPMVPELAIAMLACARIGAVHSVIFAGFSAEAIADRNCDSQAKLMITADAGWRRCKVLPLKATVDEALAKSPSVEKCIVLDRVNEAVHMEPGRDYWWHELMEMASADFPAVPMDSEAPLFILYTSGSTGKPKGIKHTTAGYNLYAKKTFQWVFDHRDDDVFWCTADCGWITGHSYVVYGPLSAGATILMYEGAPNQPTESRVWELIEKYKVTVFYTAPTAIRAFIKWGDAHITKHDLSSLRLLGTVGEGINPEAWMWYLRVSGGWLVIAHPWPGMLRGIWGDDERYQEVYWSKVPHQYLAGDNARCDEDGYYWIMGRIDDVLNVSGHRLSTIEIESALVSHPKVAEAAAVGRPDELKGEAVAVFVTLKGGTPTDELREELKKHVRKEIGALAQPDDVRFTSALPKTRSGKIMRRLLKDIAAGKETVGDTTTLEDYRVLAKLREDEE